MKLELRLAADHINLQKKGEADLRAELLLREHPQYQLLSGLPKRKNKGSVSGFLKESPISSAGMVPVCADRARYRPAPADARRSGRPCADSRP